MMPKMFNSKSFSNTAIRDVRLIWICTCILVGYVLYLRRPDAFIYPQLFAEDAVTFFTGSFCSGWHSLLVPYNGYYHLYPRLVALATLAWPTGEAARIMMWGTGLAYLAVLGYLFSPRVRLPWKPLLAVLLFLAPSDPEVLMNITNVQWFLAVGLILLVISDTPFSKLPRGIDYLMMIAASLSGPFVIMFLPLFFIRGFIRRDWFSYSLCFGAAIAAVIQGTSIVGAHTFETSVLHTNAEFFTELCHVIAVSFFSRLLRIDAALLSYLEIVWTIVFCCWIGIQCFRTRDFRIFVFICAGVVTILSSYQRMMTAPTPLFGAGRYAFLISLGIVWSLVVLAPKSKVALLHVALFIVSLTILNPTFTLRLKNYRWRRTSQCLQHAGICTIAIPPDWNIKLSMEPRENLLLPPEIALPEGVGRCALRG